VISSDRHIASAGYQPYIDGLRAVAVLLVIGFHAFPGRVPGGFVGVDVFFVISGYLISGIILRDLRSGSFSITGFYRRRIRRIFPALTVVLIAVLAFGVPLLSPAELADLGLQSASAAAFAANLTLWMQSGYFARTIEARPLLHLWSLGVEEQFYLVWPLILWLLCRRGPAAWRGMAVIGGLSFVLCVLLTSSSADAAFYSPFTRLWELAAGAVLAGAGVSAHPVAARGSKPWQDLVRQLAAVVGVCAIVAAAVGFDDSQPFPGWRAAIPVVGTALAIGAGPDAWVNRLLSLRPVAGIGLISYPLYLWHWPALSFLPVLDIAWAPAHERWLRLGAVLLALVLAYCTYVLVEVPVRFRQMGTTGFVAGAMLLPLAAGLAIAAGHKVQPLNEVQMQITSELKRLGPLIPNGYRQGRCMLEPEQNEAQFAAECSAKAESRRDGGVLIWGDSHAAQLYPGVVEAGAAGGVAQFSASMCPPILGFRPKARPHCLGINEWVYGWVQEHRPTTVILAAHWIVFDRYLAVGETVRRLRALGISNVLVVGPVPSFREPVPELLKRAASHGSIPERLYNGRIERLQEVDHELASVVETSGGTYLSPLSLTCDEAMCLVAEGGTAAGLLIVDQSHLSPAGSLYLVKRLLLRHIAARPGG
jgi:peptidoglycan/LPS O-acetylase OafA/YrhL